MKTGMRTHHCGELRKSHLGENISLCGWVSKVRDLGGLTFIDIRDRYGLTQLNFETFGDIPECSLESTILAKGVVRERPPEAQNSKMPTGDIEVLVTEFEVLSLCDKDKLPFLPHGQIESSEDLKLKYRYLDIRGAKLQKMIQARAEAARKIRNFLADQNFTEVETPILYKSTPEGARDYLVPSRVHPGKVYALPQSPQTLKQLLMIGGTDRYYQIVKCFRDEDLRADRQPEFTQIDIEASFVNEEDIRVLAENLIKEVFPVEKDFVLKTMTYDEAINKYGSDKPDLRFGLAHEDVTSLFQSSDFKVFSSVAQGRGLVKCLYLSEKEGTLARKDIDALAEVVKPFGGKGVAWFKNQGDEISGGISKFITPDILEGLKKLDCYDQGNGLWLFFGDLDSEKTHAFADVVRRHLGKKCNLIREGLEFRFVTKFPLLEYDKEGKRFYACHHPFTMPHPDDLEKFLGGKQEDLEDCKAAAYDIVCNGYEMGGGSIRIYQQDIQQRMFETLGMSKEEILHQFGFFVEALKYGTPPHAGVAFGFDRLMMLLTGTENIRDVIAFPKTATASDMMSGAPSRPHDDQWKELSLKSMAKDELRNN